MTCPFCEFAGRRQEVHAHLVVGHPDAVATRSTEAGQFFLHHFVAEHEETLSS